jgi:exodeoxyribonuclease V
MELTD